MQTQKFLRFATRVVDAVRLYSLYLVRLLFGRAVITMNFHRLSQLGTTANVLRVLGARVGNNTHIYADIRVYNGTRRGCENLTIGSNVYIGPECLFDLTGAIEIEDNVSVSARVTFITHLDVGSGVLKQSVPREEGGIAVRRGAWVGVNSTILANVTIGENAMVGAMSLVNKDIPEWSLALGIPCKVVRRLREGNDCSQLACG